MDNVRNRCLFSIPSKVEMAEEQEYLQIYLLAKKGTGSSYSSLSTSESSSSAMVFSSSASSVSELVSGKGAFVREGRLIQTCTCQLRARGR